MENVLEPAGETQSLSVYCCDRRSATHGSESPRQFCKLVETLARPPHTRNEFRIESHRTTRNLERERACESWSVLKTSEIISRGKRTVCDQAGRNTLSRKAWRVFATRVQRTRDSREAAGLTGVAAQPAVHAAACAACLHLPRLNLLVGWIAHAEPPVVSCANNLSGVFC